MHQKHEKKMSDFALIEAKSLTMPMQKDFWDARQFQQCSRSQRSVQ